MPPMALGLFWATASLCVFLVVLAADIMGLFSSKNYFEVDGRVRSYYGAVRDGNADLCGRLL